MVILLIVYQAEGIQYSTGTEEPQTKGKGKELEASWQIHDITIA